MQHLRIGHALAKTPVTFREMRTQARTQSSAQRNKANLQLAGIQRPSSLGTALKIGGAVAGAYKPDKPASYDTSFDNPKDYG